MSRKAGLLVSVLCAAFAAAAPAGAKDRAGDPRIGDKVDRICFASGINGFQTPDGIERAVVLTKGVKDKYLVDLSGGGFGSLKFAQSVAIDQRPGGGCLTRGDKLIFSDSAFGFDRTDRIGNSYLITGIYEWNEDAAAGDKNEAADEDKDKSES
ncbi:MAG: DUF6491 family protein [Amphiplicatus sp.]